MPLHFGVSYSLVCCGGVGGEVIGGWLTGLGIGHQPLYFYNTTFSSTSGSGFSLSSDFIQSAQNALVLPPCNYEYFYIYKHCTDDKLDKWVEWRIPLSIWSTIYVIVSSRADHPPTFQFQFSFVSPPITHLLFRLTDMAFQWTQLEVARWGDFTAIQNHNNHKKQRI